MDMTMTWVWLAVMVVAFIIEVVTVQIVAICFAFAALVALVSELIRPSMSIYTQLHTFIWVAAAMLVFTRPIVRRLLNFRKEDTNLGRYVGKIGKVTTEINNSLGEGQVYVAGMAWSAISSDGTVIGVGQSVVIKEIVGVKVIVEVKAEELDIKTER
ncbi:hypothetical protein FACS189481_2330 [Clostridia bacterium]|nr:hypothetical protein FACS189481_2330 [Clostridia bacterium]